MLLHKKYIRRHFAIAMAWFISTLYTTTAVRAENITSPLDTRLIQNMKKLERGPFKRILWFCKDGSTYTPKQNNCSNRGGGIQHGEWSEETKSLREKGYAVGTVYAALKENDFQKLKKLPLSLAPLIIERFLIERDDGWVFKRAKYYRGSFQIEDETKNVKELLAALVGNSNYQKNHYLLLREAVRFLPYQEDKKLVTEIRTLSSRLAENDRSFTPIKNKIHSSPSQTDIKSVSDRKIKTNNPALRTQYQRLHFLLLELYQSQNLLEENQYLITKLLPGNQRNTLSGLLEEIKNEHDKNNLTLKYSNALSYLRHNLENFSTDETKLLSIRASMELEERLFSLTGSLRKDIHKLSRREILNTLPPLLQSLYGSGLITERQLKATFYSLSRLEGEEVTFSRYKDEIGYLKLPSEWAQRNIQWEFKEAVEKMSEVEPLASQFVDDRLRGSTLLYYAELVEYLEKDLTLLEGIEHDIFSQPVRSGLRIINPGSGVGLFAKYSENDKPTTDTAKIYLVSETTSDLPHCAGIITLDAGNALSHIQLLSRSLGIPNIVVSENLFRILESRLGENVELTANTNGHVSLQHSLFKQERSTSSRSIVPDLKKLDLSITELMPLTKIKSNDSGRTVGPKAARLGELKYLFPKEVTEGIAIPFGVFREMLNKKIRPEGIGLFSWANSRYQKIKKEKDYNRKSTLVSQTLLRIRNEINNYEFSLYFEKKLWDALNNICGLDCEEGVFIRSDTNIEDLPSFTGAGLNKTLPNVRGFENILKGIKEVWASPFSERAYGWRQAYMSFPEHVYAAVLLLKSVPSDKSGVMITADVNKNDLSVLTIATSEGIGGAVDNQAAESILVNKAQGEIRLLSRATAQYKRILSPTGRLSDIPALGSDTLLTGSEINQLIKLDSAITRKFSALRDERGERTPADVEFGFANGKLALFQIRPFLRGKFSGDQQTSAAKKKIIKLRELPNLME